MHLHLTQLTFRFLYRQFFTLLKQDLSGILVVFNVMSAPPTLSLVCLSYSIGRSPVICVCTVLCEEHVCER